MASSRLRIAMSNFSKNFLDVPVYYLVNFSSFSVHYSFILCQPAYFRAYLKYVDSSKLFSFSLERR